MKIFKSNKTKLVARVMLVILLLTSALELIGCYFGAIIAYDWEVYTHEEFEKQIETYISLHDLYVDTFISFDLDDNEDISKSVYTTIAMTTSKDRGYSQKHGYMCDLYHDGTFAKRFIYYLKSDRNDYEYKIKCFFSKFDYNFTENDKIEIRASKYTKCTGHSDFSNDLNYEETILRYPSDDSLIYNHTYHYSLYVNDLEKCCIHISSIDEASEEKLNEIIQMMLNSLVIINADGFFIWRNME